MSDDTVSKLTSFGFTINQAKVYLSIVQLGRTRVGRIAKITQLHRQDIYKLLPKLEKRGLIIRTIDKPFMIEAISIEKALESVIAKEREESKERIALLEHNLKDMIDSIQDQPRLKEEVRFTLLTTDEAIKNKEKFIFRKTRKEFQVVSTIDNITRPGPNYFRDFLQVIAESKARLRLIVVSSNGKELVKQTVEKVAPRNLHLHVKHLHRSVCKNFQIIDNKEVWLATQQKTELGHSCILWTNDSNIVDAYREIFKKIWSDPRAQTILHSFAPKHCVQQLSNEALLLTSIIP
jgi:sugar-specific transcriptional regulator TrmB